MKRVKSILCMVLALALVFALAIPAFAATSEPDSPNGEMCQICGQSMTRTTREHRYFERVDSCGAYNGVHNHEHYEIIRVVTCGCGTEEWLVSTESVCPY